MKRVTEEQLLGFEDMAAKLSKISGDVGFVGVPEGDVELVVRSLSAAEYKDYVNDCMADGTRANAQTLAFYKGVLFPSRADMTLIRAQLPGVVKRVLDTIEELAGRFDAEWTPLDAGVTDDVLEEHGIPHDVATDLRKRFHNPGQLWLLRVVDKRADVAVVVFTAVVRRLGIEPHNALLARLREEGETYDASLSASMDAVLWPAEEERRRAFRAWPALSPNILLPKLLKLMKGEEETAGKGRVRRGRPFAG